MLVQTNIEESHAVTLSKRPPRPVSKIAISTFSTEKYQLQFLESEFKFKSGINRPIKIVEKNKYVRGRRKQNELLARINFNLDQSSKTTLIVFDDMPINEEEYSKIEEQKRFKQDKLHSYDPKYWKDYFLRKCENKI